MAYVLDASVWVAWFLLDDLHHTSSHELIERQIDLGDTIIGPTLLLPEVAGALSRPRGDRAVSAAAVWRLSGLPALQLMAVDDALARHAARIAGDLRLKGADAVYLALAEALGVPLVTADSEQLARGTSVAVVRTPAQALAEP
ncbi:MAG: type II toxin-antitoxin system VapC family toxin [Chloroflexi bacterium]|nr:type II toxin-antitoxin system VapC family toxin [Chloroflexota bacterium]